MFLPRKNHYQLGVGRTYILISHFMLCSKNSSQEKEATNELCSLDGRDFNLIGGGVFIAERDWPRFEVENATIGDGDAKDVRGEIFESRFAGAHGLRMSNPINR
jgi:hypothetical protein